MSRKTLFIFGGFFALICGVILISFIIRNQEQTGSNANTETAIPAAVCGSSPVDVVLVIDRSDSMSGQKITDAKAAASNFVDVLAKNTKNRVALVSFAPTATINVPLTNNYSSVKTAINNLSLAYGTCTQCAVDKTSTVLTNDTGTNKKVVVLLTDGRANWLEGGTSQVSFTTGEQAAITAVNNAPKVPYFTIGLGNDVFPDFLQKIAIITGGLYYFAPTSSDLNQIYQNISQIIGKGSILGTVFNDINNNGVLDNGEPNLSGWNVNLKVGSASSSAMLTTTTASTSGYSFTGLCDGTYYVDEKKQAGWQQTTPLNPNYYTVSIANGNTIVHEDFGNAQRACGTACVDDTSCSGASNSCTSCNPNTKKCSVPFTPTPTPSMTPTPTLSPTPTLTPTPTLSPAPQDITLSIIALLHNIGDSGDNANPAYDFSNKNPLHPTRSVQAFIYDLNNEQIASASGTVQYDATHGDFTGTVDAGTIPNGKYYVKIQTDYHLRRLVPGILTLTSGMNTLPPLNFVAGDVNTDNQLDILDYNELIGCYGSNPPACSDSLSVATDLNDDGTVDEKDYNLFIRELSVQNGE